ncbi:MULTISPECIES: hypothetical protein [Nocardioides]|uniref:Alpha/beta hydrolase n=1 Tax=Nocardioides vastitatis TaxID=2568655 RepID=A0ABW0ZF26_9ACTN|nr:hypothetical protein [Nocardioides sp.]
MTRFVDHVVDGTAVGRCVVLPGRRYTPDGPLLFFATQVALMRGWDVRQVWWEPPALDGDAAEVAWVGAQLGAALDDHDGRVLVVAKSLGTLAAPLAAARGYDAAWLTPLLTEPDVAEVLLSYPAEQFVMIGASDPYLSREVLDALPGERVVVPGDHVLRVPGDAAAMVASHDRFVRSFDAWLGVIR